MGVASWLPCVWERYGLRIEKLRRGERKNQGTTDLTALLWLKGLGQSWPACHVKNWMQDRTLMIMMFHSTSWLLYNLLILYIYIYTHYCLKVWWLKPTARSKIGMALCEASCQWRYRHSGWGVDEFRWILQRQIQGFSNGHFRNLKWRYLPYIRPI